VGDLSDDKVNGFNVMSRAAIFRGLRRWFPDLIPEARFFYEQASRLWCRDADGRRVHARDGAGTQYRAEEGATQGDPWGPFLWSVGYHEALPETQARHPDVTILEYLDDTYYLQVAAAAVAAMRAGTECTLRLCGVASNLAKQEAYSPAGDLSVVPPTIRGSTALLADGRSRGTALATVIVLGSFIGDEAEASDRLVARVEKAPAPLARVVQLRDTRRHKIALQVQLEMLRLCSNTSLPSTSFCGQCRLHLPRLRLRGTMLSFRRLSSQ
jgi:tRNA threonylcarbamoyladenosine modification (KEOPS) complex  Pcc1 subunit